MCAKPLAIREMLMPHEVPQGPSEKLAIDFFEFQSDSFPSTTDYYSRFLAIRRVRSSTASATGDNLNKAFSKHGVTKTVMSDNGPQFSSL